MSSNFLSSCLFGSIAFMLFFLYNLSLSRILIFIIYCTAQLKIVSYITLFCRYYIRLCSIGKVSLLKKNIEDFLLMFFSEEKNVEVNEPEDVEPEDVEPEASEPNSPITEQEIKSEAKEFVSASESNALKSKAKTIPKVRMLFHYC